MPFSRGPSRPGIEPLSIMSPTLGGVFFTASAIWEAHFNYTWIKYFFKKKEVALFGELEVILSPLATFAKKRAITCESKTSKTKSEVSSLTPWGQ